MIAAIAAAVVGAYAGPAVVELAANAKLGSASSVPIVGEAGRAIAHRDYDTIASVAIGVGAFVILRRYL